MSLVDYASSSDDDEIAEQQQLRQPPDQKEEEEEDQREEKKKNATEEPTAPPSLPPPFGPHNLNFTSSSSSSSSSSHQPSHGVTLPSPQLEKLPDASLLFASSFSSPQTFMSDHSSRVAAAMAASESRKRESNGSALAYRRSKEPKGQMPPTRNIPDTVGGKLIPPQLRGRSNVVTEDISKLFVRSDGQNLSSSR